MELNDVIRAIRTKRWVLVNAVLLGLALAAALSVLTPRTYSSSTQLFVSVSNPGVARSPDPAATAYQNNQFSQQRAISYVQILTGRPLAQEVVDDLKLRGMSAAALASRVDAKPLPDTVIINVSVTDSTPEHAQAIAASLGRNFIRRVAELETPDGATDSTVKVSTVQPAEFNPAPVSPNIPRTVALGGALGLLVGLALALAQSRLDRTLRTPEEVRETARVGVMGRVFEDQHLARKELATALDATSPVAEAYRALAVNLQHVDGKQAPKVVVVTSALPDEGKSTVALNLAVSLARSGSRVVLVDGNLWRPRVLRYLGMAEGPGLTDVLTARAELPEVARTWGKLRLTVLGAGSMPSEPAEILGSAQMRSLLNDLRDTFDFVIIDTPALLPVVDAAVLGVLADGCVLVTRVGKTKRDQLAEAVGALGRVHAKLLGVVVNRLPQADAIAPANYRGYKADADRRSGVLALPPDRHSADVGSDGQGATSPLLTAQRGIETDV